jgi:hypothetical protein
VKLVNCIEQKNHAKTGNLWEKKYGEFESYDGMPKRGTPLYNWQQSQLSNTHVSCLNAKILKELAENKGSVLCVQAIRFQGVVVIMRYQSLPLPPGKVLPICVTQ